MTKQEKSEQRLEWIAAKLKAEQYCPEFISYEIKLLRENNIGKLAGRTYALITSNEIYERFGMLPTIIEAARESKMKRPSEVITKGHYKGLRYVNAEVGYVDEDEEYR